MERYPWQSDFARQYVEHGREEGLEEGREEGVARSVISVLRARGFIVSEEVRQRVKSCGDLEMLEAWVSDAVTVERPEDLWYSEFARKYVGIGRAEAAARSVIAVLVARGFAVSDEVRQRVESCDDLEILEAWVPKAVAVDRPEDLFG